MARIISVKGHRDVKWLELLGMSWFRCSRKTTHIRVAIVGQQQKW